MVHEATGMNKEEWRDIANETADELNLPKTVLLPTQRAITKAIHEEWMTNAHSQYEKQLNTLTAIAEELDSGEIDRATLQEQLGGASGTRAMLKLFADLIPAITRLLTSNDSHSTVAAYYLHAFRMEEIFWAVIPENKRQQDGEPIHRPVKVLIKEWLLHENPYYASALVAGNRQRPLVRVNGAHKTAAFANWQPAPDAEAVIVDGEPVATWHHPQSVYSDGRPLPLPGGAKAHRLQLAIRATDQYAGDRRGYIHTDSFFLLALASALTEPLALQQEHLGAWLQGTWEPNDLSPEAVIRLRDRAGAAIGFLRNLIRLPDGTRIPLAHIDSGGLPEGTWRIHPYRVGELTSQSAYRLTGTLTTPARRHGKSAALARVVAAMEDTLSYSGWPGGAERRPHLLIPENDRKTGPGPIVTVTYIELLARAGYVFDLRNPDDYNRIKTLWNAVKRRLRAAGYMLEEGQTQAIAGDTVEIVRFTTGYKGQYSTVTFRASDRFTEAQRQVSNARKGKKLEIVPLPALLKMNS